MSAPPMPPLVSRVELSVSARDLEMMILDTNSPLCVVYLKDETSRALSEVGRTEKREGETSPQWVKKFEMDYMFERRQLLQFHLFHWKKDGHDLSYQTKLGVVEVTLGEIMAARGGHLQRKIPWAENGVLLISAVEMGGSSEVVRFGVSAHGLDRKGFAFAKSSPYLSIFKVVGDSHISSPMQASGVVYGLDTAVHRTEVVSKSHSPVWKEFEVSAWSLCEGDEERQIKFACHSKDDDVEDSFIGECYVSLRRLREMRRNTNNTLDLINPKKTRKKRSYQNSGQLTFNVCEVTKEVSFLEYIQAGMQIHFTVAVDFTASNGDPRIAGSLHHVDNVAFTDNDYACAIRSVGEIIEHYDSDKMFPALGFGALVPPSFQRSDEFFLNGSPDNPYCQGIQGVLRAYQHAVRTVQLHGPSNLAPVINHVANFATAHQEGKNYFVLLILTNGKIADMRETVSAIVKASALPMSIIVVGVGSGDFRDMSLIDGSKRPVHLDGVYAARNIVQFVEFRKHADGVRNNPDVQRYHLAQEVLQQVPLQVTAWMKHKDTARCFAASAPPMSS